ncbi:MAG: sigma-54-dependent Fis family transcriptional regulator [Melioribacteraceae bacterium]|nr:sigma-54-dependent Fis family transcriptional regulator [Melioribacteraceae bacterium]
MAFSRNINILLIEDEDFDVQRVKNTVNYYESNLKIKDTVSNGRAALELLNINKDAYDVVILDYQISGGLMGEELIKRIKEADPFIQIIVITKMTINITDYDFANKLIRAGAFWYCTKYPGNIEEYIYQPTDFILSIFNAWEKKRLEKHRRQSDSKLRQNVDNLLELKKIIGDSEPMVLLKNNIEKFAKSEVNILINGASGTGKELVAWNVHLKSKRKYENFVPINCGSLPHDLIESELFGYEKGSFTGANGSKAGLFEIADKGTIFLDEVAELPLSAQVKLLRVIQEGEIEKIGRTKKISVDVRIIAATNKNLQAEVDNKNFREDLFYRLNVLPIDIVGLNQRGKDILQLIDHFLNYYSIDMELECPAIDDDAKEILMNYKWSGNVRELRNVVQRLILNSDGKITAGVLNNPMILRNNSQQNDVEKFENMDFGNVMPLRDMERIFRSKYFKYVRSISGSDSNAADKLGLAPSNFYRMCKELGLK